MPNTSYSNSKITQEDGTKYEISWLTNVAQEMSDRLVQDMRENLHVALSFTEIVSLLRRAPRIIPIPDSNKPYLHICATKHKTKSYEIFVNLVPELDGLLPRCLVIDYRVSTEEAYRTLSEI